MRTSLSKSEFASALGMKADAVFVKKMFNIVDKDSDGRISFQVNVKSLKKTYTSLTGKQYIFLNQYYRNSWTQ